MKDIFNKCKNYFRAIFPFAVLIGFSINGSAQVSITGPSSIDFRATNVAYTLDRDGRPASDFSNIVWSARGDLQLESVSVDGFTAFYSSVKRSTAGQILEGYGLGQVVVIYTDSLRPSICGRPSLGKRISKQFEKATEIDGIIGTSCVNTGDTVTYSILPIVSVNINDRIGIDKYKWTLPVGWESGIQFFSGDSSSITFIVGPLSGNDVLKVDIGEANFLDTFEYELPLAQGVAEPVLVQAPPECLPVSTTRLEIEVDSVSGVEYNWEIPANWQFIENTTANSSRIVLGIDNRPGDLVLTLLAGGPGGCSEPLIREFEINRELDATTSITATGAAATGCVSRPGTYTFSVNAPIAISWGIPAEGWSLELSNPTNSTVNITAGATAQSGYITAQSLDCGGTIDSLFIQIAPDTPGPISDENSCLPAGSTVSRTYTVAAVENATSYTWSTSNPNWALSDITTTVPSVDVTPDGTSSTLFVRANGCASSGTRSLFIDYEPEAPQIGGDICLPAGGSPQSSYQYTVTNPVAGTTYQWRVTGGLTITSGQNTPTINVGASGDVTGDTVEVSATTCGTVTTTRTVTEEGDKGLTFTINKFPIGSFGNAYAVDPSTFDLSGAIFTWTFNNVEVQSGSDPLFLSCSESGDLKVVIVKQSECLLANAQTTVVPCPPSSLTRVATDDEVSSEGPTGGDFRELLVYPNPSDDQVTVQLPVSSNNNTWQLTLFNSKGQIMWKGSDTGGKEARIDVSKMVSGHYYLAVNNGGNPIIKKLMIH